MKCQALETFELWISILSLKLCWSVFTTPVDTNSTVQFHDTFCHQVSLVSKFWCKIYLSLVWWAVYFEMKNYVYGENYTVCLCINCTGGERHAGGSNYLSEDFETHTRLSHVLYSSNSLCVYRLQVQHCVLVWDSQLFPHHCSLQYVQDLSPVWLV